MKQRTRNIVFLDINGVIMPIGTHDYLHYKFTEIKEAYVNKDVRYQNVDALDLAAVEFGWDIRAVMNLRKLVEITNAEIVITSSWRIGRSLEELKLLFDIYELGSYVCDVTVEANSKEEEIEIYIWGHGIENYVILDDLDMRNTFASHFIHVKEGYLHESVIEDALHILKKDEYKH